MQNKLINLSHTAFTGAEPVDTSLNIERIEQMKRSREPNNIMFVVKMIAVAGFLVLAFAISTGDSFAASPIITAERVQLRTMANGDVGVTVSATVEDLDGISGLKVTVERPGVFGPFPLQTGLYLLSGTDSPTLDTFTVTIGPEFIPDAQRAGDYIITVNDGGVLFSTAITLPAGLTPLAAGGPTSVNTGTDLLRPTISIPSIPGAYYRILISNDSDSTIQVVDRVSGPTLSSTPSIQLGTGTILAGKFYRFNIDAFDASTVESSDRRSESADICYDPATGNTNIPCFIRKDVHLFTKADGTVAIRAIAGVQDLDDLAYLKNPPPTNPPTVPVTVTRGVLGPFALTPSLLITLDLDSDVRDNFTSAQNPLDATEIPEGERAGDYTFRAEDSTGNVVTVTRFFPAGMVALPVAGPVTIDTSSGSFTPTVSIPAVPGATHYRVVVFNDTDSTIINFDNLPGGTLSESPTIELFGGVIESGKAYRIQMEAFNSATYSTSTLRSRSASLVYDPSNLDSDGDGIQNTIDGQFAVGFVSQSATASNNFTNQHLGGHEFGSIVDRADLNVVVVAPSDPADGLRLGASGGIGTAIVNACLSTVEIRLRDNSAVAIYCGSLDVDVLEGVAEFQLGNGSVVTAPPGAVLTIEEPSPGQYSVENSPASFVPVTLQTQGELITISPWVSIIGAKIAISPILPNIIFPASRLPVQVTIFSSSDFNASEEIDQSTLRFGRTGSQAMAQGCLKLGRNPDHKSDLLCTFATRDSGFLLGDTVGLLRGRTVEGKLIQGSDRVKINPGFKQ